MNSIELVLQKFIKKDKEKVTHTIIPNENNTYFQFGKSFHVPMKDLLEFNNHICNYLFNTNILLSHILSIPIITFPPMVLAIPTSIGPKVSIRSTDDKKAMFSISGS